MLKQNPSKQLKWQRKNIIRGLCRNCGKPGTPNCPECLAKIRLYQRKKKGYKPKKPNGVGRNIKDFNLEFKQTENRLRATEIFTYKNSLKNLTTPF